MIRKLLQFSMLMLLASHGLQAQISFEKTYNRINFDSPSSVIEVPEGYLVAGTTYTQPPSKGDGLLLMFDHQGELLWHRIYGTLLQRDEFSALVQANDGGFIAVGSTFNLVTDYDAILIVHTDNQGNMTWTKTINGSVKLITKTIFSIPDGYIISGYREAGIPNHRFGFALRIDNQGNTIWSKYFETESDSDYRATYAEGNILYLNGYADWIPSMMQVDLQSGDIVSNQVLENNPGTEALYDLHPTTDGQLIYSGRSRNPIGQWVRKTDKQGQVIWSRVYSQQYAQDNGLVTVCDDGGYLLTATEFWFGNNTKPILTKLDGNGNIDWSYTYGNQNQQFKAAIQTQDGGFLAIGTSQPTQYQSSTDILVVKTRSNGLVDGCCARAYPIVPVDYYPLSGTGDVVAKNLYQSTPIQIYSDTAHFTSQAFCAYVAPIKQIDLEICFGRSVEINGIIYSTAAVVFDTLKGTADCDTILKYDISVLPAIAATHLLEFCPGDSIVLNGQVFYQPDTVQFFLPAMAGCDTVETYFLQYYANLQASQLAISCPAPINVDAAPGAGSAVVTYGAPNASSDCFCPEISIALEQGLTSGSAFPLGETLLCFQALDQCGTSNRCCFTVTVHKTDPPEDPCDEKTIGCIQYELLSIEADALGNHRFRIGVTNRCDAAMRYFAVQVPDGVMALSPPGSSIFVSENGREYDVRNPSFTPFNSVRFTSLGAGIANGTSDVLEYVLPAEAPAPLFIRVFTRLGNGLSYETYLNTFGCPLLTGNRSGTSPEKITQGDKPVLYPNPASDRLFIDCSAWAPVPVMARLYDPQGHLRQSMGWDSSAAVLDLDLSNLNAGGLYYLELRSENGKRELFKVAVVPR